MRTAKIAKILTNIIGLLFMFILYKLLSIA